MKNESANEGYLGSYGVYVLLQDLAHLSFVYTGCIKKAGRSDISREVSFRVKSSR